MARFVLEATPKRHGWPMWAQAVAAAAAALAVLVVLLGTAQERHVFGERIFAVHSGSNGTSGLTVTMGGSRLRFTVERGEANRTKPAGVAVPPMLRSDRLAPGTFTCEASGHCSLGKCRTWRGDIATNAALRDMLEAVAFKKEIIFTTFDEGQVVYHQMALNSVLSLEDLGMSHMVLLALNEALCVNLPAALDRISCVWDSRPMSDGKDVGGLFNTYSKRWETLARIARMGFNVMSVDSDTLFLHNPYVFLKSGPLAQFNLLSQGGGGWDVNCGVMYWQNAHPSGAAVWAAVAHADRSIRQREGYDGMVAVYPKWTPEYTWEQAVWCDIFMTLFAGVPIYANGAGKSGPPEAWQRTMQPLIDQLRVDMPPPANEAVPPEWVKVTGQPEVPVWGWHNLSVPRPPTDTWWAEHGSLLYPLERGPKSQAWIQLIQEASDAPYAELDKPWAPPQPPPPPEAVGFFPDYFVTWWGGRGAWTFGKAETPLQVISHIVYVPAESSDWKAYVFKGNNWWHWDVTESYSSTAVGMPDPRLLMLAPGVQLMTDTEAGFRNEVAKLAALAEAMGRRLVVPPVPCDSPWVGLTRSPPTTLPPEVMWEESYDAIQVLQFHDRQRPGHKYCFWMRGTIALCTALLPAHIDAVAFLERNLTAEQAAPSAANTLWFQEWADRGGAEAGGGTASVPTTVEAATAAATPMAAAPVVFLGARPQWQGEVPGLSQEIKDACRFLQDEYVFFADENALVERRKKIAETATAAAAAADVVPPP